MSAEQVGAALDTVRAAALEPALEVLRVDLCPLWETVGGLIDPGLPPTATNPVDALACAPTGERPA